MRKKPHGRILRGEPKEQHLSSVPKSCSSSIIPLFIKFIYSKDFPPSRKPWKKMPLLVRIFTRQITF